MSQEQAPVLDGRVLRGTYLVEGLLAEGGMGAVYRVKHLRTGGAMAMKRLYRAALLHPEVVQRFRDEAQIISSLRHPNIVQVMDFDEDEDGTPFLVMELLDGEDLMQRLKQRGPLPLAEVLEMARQVGGALQAAHDSGIVHRDVKPQNIFFCRHQAGSEIFEEVKVVDFGLSKMRGAPSQQTQEHLIPGTPYYMAPEVARGRSADVDGRADQFSLAVVLYRALAGRLPFDDDHDIRALIEKVLYADPVPLAQLVPIPAHVGTAMARALAKEREDRFPSIADFIRALTAKARISGLRADSPSAQVETVASIAQRTSPSATGQYVRVSRRRGLGPVAGAAMGAAAVALLFGALRLFQRPPVAPEPAAAPPPVRLPLDPPPYLGPEPPPAGEIVPAPAIEKPLSRGEQRKARRALAKKAKQEKKKAKKKAKKKPRKSAG